MSDIASLKEAIETARTAYTRASEQHARSRKHALSLIHIVEEQLREKRIELSQNDIQRERMSQEHGQLRQMLHALVMAVEVDAAESPESDPAVIEARPNGVTPLAPVAVVSETKDPAAATDENPKARRKPRNAETAKSGGGTSADEVRAGLKRMLQKKRVSATELNAIQTEVPTPAEK